jgi:hypothetical protein
MQDSDVMDILVLCYLSPTGPGCLNSPPYSEHRWMELRAYLGDLLLNLGVKAFAAWERLGEDIITAEGQA